MASGNKLSDKKVMWVEDDQFLSEMIAKKLRDEGAELQFAGNGTEAMEILSGDYKPDILLLDILLPEMSGFEVLEKIKSEKRLQDVPVILFSNLGQQEDIDKGYSLGADKFLVKATVDLNGVIDEINELLEEKAAGKKRAQPKEESQAAQPSGQVDSQGEQSSDSSEER